MLRVRSFLEYARARGNADGARRLVSACAAAKATAELHDCRRGRPRTSGIVAGRAFLPVFRCVGSFYWLSRLDMSNLDC